MIDAFVIFRKSRLRRSEVFSKLETKPMKFLRFLYLSKHIVVLTNGREAIITAILVQREQRALLGLYIRFFLLQFFLHTEKLLDLYIRFYHFVLCSLFDRLKPFCK